jgi:hypothetical protein
VQIHSPRFVKAQTPIAPLASNSPAIIAFPSDEQRKAAKRREMALSLARKRRMEKKRPRPRPNIVVLTIIDLETFFGDRYGHTFPDDDAGREDLIVLLKFMAQLGDPFAMSACAARWCPWLSEAEYAAMLAGIEPKRLRWNADGLAAEIGLNRATRSPRSGRSTSASASAPSCARRASV